MKTVSMAEAKAKLPALVQAAEAGEQVVITRHGQPVAEVTPIRTPSHQDWLDGLDWLASRWPLRTPADQDAASLIREMRDEGDH